MASLSHTPHFKLDPSSLPKLESDGRNYQEWRSTWLIAFQYAKVLDIIINTRPRPTLTTSDVTSSSGTTAAATSTTQTAEQAAEQAAEHAANVERWLDDDNKAMVMIISAVHQDIMMLVTTTASAHQAWLALQERFDHDTAYSTILQFRQLTTMRLTSEEDLIQHLESFHQLWTSIEQQCRTSSHSLSKSFSAVFSTEDVKGSFFLSSLPDSMDNIVDNLSTQNITRFTDIRPKMLDIAQRQNQPKEESAYYTRTAAKPNQTGRSGGRGNPQSSTTPSPTNECTWCKKHNMSFIGHIYTNCKKLAEHKQKRTTGKGKSNNTNQSSKRRENARQATADTNGDESDIGSVQAFLATCDVEPPTSDARSATIRSSQRRSTTIDLTEPDQPTAIQAFAVNITPQSLSVSSSWIFDSSTSRHISGHHSDFLDLQPRTGTISIAGGAKLPVKEMGSVRVLLRLPNGAAQPTIFTDVLYSRHLMNTRLFS